MNSKCDMNLQCDGEKAYKPVPDSELAIDINSDFQNYEDSDVDNQKSSLLSEYKFEQNVERLIRASKQLQKNYETQKIENKLGNLQDDHFQTKYLAPCSNALLSLLPPVFETNQLQHYEYNKDLVNFYFNKYLTTPQKENVRSSNSSQRFTSRIPKVGPYGTGIIRPPPKKHSCVQNIQLTSIKRSYRTSRNIRPYSAKYYNFERTHPNLELIDNGETIIPKRVLKQIPDKRIASGKPLLKNGITWHELFSRGKVYSAKSLQHVSTTSSATPDRTKYTQTSISESFSIKGNPNLKFEKRVLPQLNIRAECTVQKIPELSIAPNEMKCFTKPNIKLVEIIYEESETIMEVKQISAISSEHNSPKQDEAINKEQAMSHGNTSSQPPFVLQITQNKINDNTKVTESATSLTMSSSISSNREHDISLEQSTSLNVSRISLMTDHETARSLVQNRSTTAQHPTKQKRYVKHRKDIIENNAIKSSSDPSEFEFDRPEVNNDLNAILNVQLPTFPSNQLIQLVDDIFDTSSDGCGDNNRINKNRLQMVKETSVQTDIVWENLNEFLRQQSKTIGEQLNRGTNNVFADDNQKPTEIPLLNRLHLCEDKRLGAVGYETGEKENYTVCGTALLGDGLPEKLPSNSRCPHTSFKKLRVCSCLGCQRNIKFSVVNIHRSKRDIKSSDSSSAVIVNNTDKFEPNSSIRTKLLPSERYKQMKLAQREHFENDPRISKTLNKIYDAAKMFKTPSDTSSSSSNRKHLIQLPRVNNFSNVPQDESLHPDLYTFSDELLLFGSSSDDYEYSSRLLKTISSQDTCSSNEKFCDPTTKKDIFARNMYTCTNSEDSSCPSFKAKPVSDLEQYLMNDMENSWSDPTMMNSVFSTSSLERKINEIQINEGISQQMSCGSQ